MNIREEIQRLISDALSSLDISYDGEVILDYPDSLDKGDFATPLALQLAKKINRDPKELATQIVNKIVFGDNSGLSNFADSNIVSIHTPSRELIGKFQIRTGNTSIDGLEVAGPGFINFTLSKQYWAELRSEILHLSDKWGSGDLLVDKQYLVEHSSPNMFKPFHVGHLVNNFVGASLNRIIQASGARTQVISFPSDVSPGIAKAVWGLMNKGWSDEFTTEQVGEAYAYGSTQYKEDENAKKEIDIINLELYQKQDTPAYHVYERGLAQSYEYFKNITTRLGSTFEDFIPESECEVEGKRIVAQHTPGIFTESQGAIIFEGSKYGLFDNVFINSAGYGTYLTKDIGLLSRKFEKFTFDRSLTVTDIEQKQHFQLVKKAAELINSEWAEKSTYIQHGRLALTSGKISSRDGGVPLAETLLDEVKDRVLEKTQDRDIEDKDEVAEQVALGALKYAILKSATGKNITFDLEKDLAFEGATGPYIQYAYVRAMSAVEKARSLLTGDELTTRTGETPNLERMLVRFPSVVEKSLADYSPHHIAVYLHELASEFNSFYAQTKIAEKNPDLLINIQLAEAVAVTLKNGLYLLGIETVEEM